MCNKIQSSFCDAPASSMHSVCSSREACELLDSADAGGGSAIGDSRDTGDAADSLGDASATGESADLDDVVHSLGDG